MYEGSTILGSGNHVHKSFSPYDIYLAIEKSNWYAKTHPQLLIGISPFYLNRTMSLIKLHNIRNSSQVFINLSVILPIIYIRSFLYINTCFSLLYTWPNIVKAFLLFYLQLLLSQTCLQYFYAFSYPFSSYRSTIQQACKSSNFIR